MTDEIFKQVEGYENKYMISNMGRLLIHRTNQFMVPNNTGKGHM